MNEYADGILDISPDVITLKSDTDRISVPIEVNQEFAEYQKDQQERE